MLPEASMAWPVLTFSNTRQEGYVDSCGLREGGVMSVLEDDVSLDAGVDASVDASLDDPAYQGRVLSPRLQLPVSLDMRTSPLSPALSLDVDFA